jgi:heat shock protein HslJ
MHTRIRRIAVGAVALVAVVALVAACSGSSGSGLTGKTWQAVAITETTPAFQGVIPPDQQANYTITFEDDGKAAIKADCNTVAAEYTTGADNAITITLGAGTLMACPEGSMDQQFTMALSTATRYEISGSTLKLTNPNGSLELAAK